MRESGDAEDVERLAELDGFVIEAVAGRGGMGVVYRARQMRPERYVALKVISAALADQPEFRRRFQRESNLAARIEHPNVIPVYAVGEADNGVLYIAMRFVDGVDLRTLLQQEGRLAPHRAALIIDQVAQALDAAHSHGLVHRDVKPANILISRVSGREHVYLSDFGLSREVEASQALTGTGMFLGTIDYVAPEQARGAQVTAQTDVYSLGCVLFHALTGSVPFPLENDVAKLYAHGAEPPPSPLERVSSLPVAFESVLFRAMAKEPGDRYLSAGDFGRAAVAAAAGAELSRTERAVAVGSAASPPRHTARTRQQPASIDAPPASTPRTHVLSPRGHRAKPLAAVVIAAAIAGIGLATLTGGPGPMRVPPLPPSGVQMYIRSDGTVFAKASVGLGSWTAETAAGAATNAAVGGNTQMIVSHDGAVMARSAIGIQPWTVETKARTGTKIAASSTGVQMFVRRDGALFAKKSIVSGGWTQETDPGTAIGIAAGGTTQMLLRRDGAIFATDSIGRSGWRAEGARTAIGIAVSATGLQMYASRDGSVFAKPSLRATKWTRETTPGSASAVDVAGGTQMFLHPDGAVFAKSALGYGGWIQETPTKAASALDVNAAGVQVFLATDDTLFAKRTIGYGGWTQETARGDASDIATG